MKRLFHFALAIVICAGCSKEVALRDNIAAVKAIGTAGDDKGYYITEHPDGGWLLFGQTNGKGAGQMDFYEAWLDEHLNVRWDTTYGSSGPDGMTVRYLETYNERGKKDRDGNILIWGFLNKSGAVLKFDPRGRLLKTALVPPGDSNGFAATTLSTTPSGHYYVAGLIYQTGSVGLLAYPNFLTELDAGLNPTTYSLASLDAQYIWPYSVANPDGSYTTLYVGFSNIVTGGHTRIVNGAFATEEFYYELPGIPALSTVAVRGYQLLSDGSSVISMDYFDEATGNENGYIIKRQGDQTVWYHKDLPTNLCNGHFAVDDAGNLYGLNFETPFVTKFAPDGTLLWQKNISFGGEFVTAICPNADGSILVCMTSGIAGRHSADMSLFRLDSQGNLITD